jgi:hypothetical protein
MAIVSLAAAELDAGLAPAERGELPRETPSSAPLREDPAASEADHPVTARRVKFCGLGALLGVLSDPTSQELRVHGRAAVFVSFDNIIEFSLGKTRGVGGAATFSLWLPRSILRALARREHEPPEHWTRRDDERDDGDGLSWRLGVVSRWTSFGKKARDRGAPGFATSLGPGLEIYTKARAGFWFLRTDAVFSRERGSQYNRSVTLSVGWRIDTRRQRSPPAADSRSDSRAGSSSSLRTDRVLSVGAIWAT